MIEFLNEKRLDEEIAKIERIVDEVQGHDVCSRAGFAGFRRKALRRSVNLSEGEIDE